MKNKIASICDSANNILVRVGPKIEPLTISTASYPIYETVDEILEEAENGPMAEIVVYRAYKDKKLVMKVYPLGHIIHYTQ